MPAAGPAGIDPEPIAQTALFNQIGEDPFCQWRPTDVSETDKQNSGTAVFVLRHGSLVVAGLGPGLFGP